MRKKGIPLTSLCLIALACAVSFPCTAQEPCEDSVFASVHNDTVTVYHTGSFYNCCAVIEYTLIEEDSILDLTEKETFGPDGPCYCMCCLDLSVDISGLEPGTYLVRVWDSTQSVLYGQVWVTVGGFGGRGKPTITGTTQSDCYWESFVCGDSNGDGYVWTMADLLALLNYFFEGGPLPSPGADVDSCCGVTFNDLASFTDYLVCGRPGFCPPNCVEPSESPDDTIELSNAYASPGQSCVAVTVTLINSQPVAFLTIPLGYYTPYLDADSVAISTLFSDWLQYGSIDDDSGTVVIALADKYTTCAPDSLPSGIHELFTVFFSVAPATPDTVLTIDTVSTQRFWLQTDCFIPIIRPGIFTITPLFIRGDADGSGGLTIGDGLRCFRCQFVPGWGDSCRCDDAVDANDNGAISIGDCLRILRKQFVPGWQDSIPPPCCSAPGDCGPDPTSDGIGCDEHPCMGGVSADAKRMKVVR